MQHTLKAHSKNLGKELDELLGITDVLREDLNQTLNIEEQLDLQTWRRHLIRASWALFEGYIYGIKLFIKKACTLGSEELTEKEMKLIDEGVFIIDTNGVVKWETNYESTINNIKKTLKLSSNKFDLNWAPDFNDNGWKDLRDSITIRHRIVHPKSIASLEITDAEIEAHKNSISWFIKSKGSE